MKRTMKISYLRELSSTSKRTDLEENKNTLDLLRDAVACDIDDLIQDAKLEVSKSL